MILNRCFCMVIDTLDQTLLWSYCRCSWSPRATTYANSTRKNIEQHYYYSIVDCVPWNFLCYEKLLNMTEKTCAKVRSRHPEVFYKKSLKNFAKSTAKYLCQILFVFLGFIDTITSTRPPTLRKSVRRRCFPVEFAKFVNTFLTEHLQANVSKN